MPPDTELIVVRRVVVFAALAASVAVAVRIQGVAGAVARVANESLPVLVVVAVIGMTAAGRQMMRDGKWSAGLVRSLMVLGWVLGGGVLLRRVVLSMGLV